MKPTFVLLFSVATCAITLARPTAAQAPGTAKVPTVLHCPAMIDSKQGKLMGPTSIVIENDRIKEVVPGVISRAGATDVELPGHTCLPGLIDMHTHIASSMPPGHTRYTDRFYSSRVERSLRGTPYLRNTLYLGFTTIRTLGDDDFNSVDMRNAINGGFMVGPRIFTAGTAISSTGGHADPTNGLAEEYEGGENSAVINGPEEARKAVREHYKRGADLIKIMTSGGVLDLGSNGDNPQLTIEEIKAIVDTAHDYGFRVAVHALGAEGIHRAVVAGVDSIEHGSLANEADLRLMKEKGIYLVPTLIIQQTAYENALKPGFYPPAVSEKALKIAPHGIATAKKAYELGVKIAYGTDSGEVPHTGDFALLVKIGMPPMAVIQSATTVASDLLGQSSDLGSIEQGKIADVVAVPGNPLDDISRMKSVDFVMKAGVIYKQDGKPVL